MAVTAASALFSTVKRRLNYADPHTDPYRLPSDGTFIYVVWHDSLMMPLFLGRQPRTIALVGRHQDGAFLAQALKSLKIGAVRGSSSRGGAEAIHQLFDQQSDHHFVVTPDGPRGPRREMKPGVAFLASRTGKPVVCTAFACRRSWSIGTGWTNLTIPKPWTTLFAAGGERITVPPDADKSTLEDCTRKIQQEMDRLCAAVEALADEQRSDHVIEQQQSIARDDQHPG